MRFYLLTLKKQWFVHFCCFSDPTIHDIEIGREMSERASVS